MVDSHTIAAIVLYDRIHIYIYIYCCSWSCFFSFLDPLFTLVTLYIYSSPMYYYITMINTTYRIHNVGIMYIISYDFLPSRSRLTIYSILCDFVGSRWPVIREAFTSWPSEYTCLVMTVTTSDFTVWVTGSIYNLWCISGRDTSSWKQSIFDPYKITTKWLTMNMKLPGTSHGRF
jgi:hypothetical protein